MRVVLDTNILISACLKPAGLEAALVTMALSGELTAFVSKEVLAEYRDVLFRDKFRGVRARAEAMLVALEGRAIAVITTSPIHAAKDEDDNRLLECAAAAGAAYLITGNLKDFPETWGTTKMVNARQFLDAVFPGRC